MKSSLFKKSFALLLAVLMLVTAVPAGVFAAEKDLPVMKAYPYISASNLSAYDYHEYRNSIVTATFLDEIDTKGAVKEWDISASSDTGTVKAWIKLNAEETAAANNADRYDLYIGGDGGVSANPNSTQVFSLFPVLKKVNGLENYHTDNVTNLSWFFEGCASLESVNLSSFNTSKVTNLSYFMIDCNNLKSVNFSGWDTSNVTTTNSMFKNCFELVTLDLSSFDTSKITTMQYMFYKCKKLLYIYAGDGWTTEAIKNINEGVFNCCYAIFGVTEEEYNNLSYAPPASAVYASYGKDGYLVYKAPVTTTEYKVTYKFIGDIIPDGMTAPSEAIYEEGTPVIVADNASAEHYIFSGWSTEDADVVNGEFIINNDVEFVGSWIKLYKVEYKYDENFEVPAGAPEIPDVELWYAPGENVPVYGIPYVDKYVFVGWNTKDAEVIGDSFIMPENDVELKGFYKIPVEGIGIVGGDMTIDIGGKEVKVEVYVNPEYATFKGVIFESDDESIVEIDQNGVLTPKNEGTTTITITSVDDPTKTDTVTVTVKIPVTDISVDKNEIALNKGDTDKITVTEVKPSEATNKEVTYESSNPDVVTVDEDGNIVAVGDGTATITVTSKDNEKVKEKVTVTVKTPVTDLTAREDFTLNLGDSENLDAKVNADATNKGLEYKSSDSSVVKVDSSGDVFAYGEGTATITITSKDNSSFVEYVTITVVPKKYNVTYEFEGDVPENVTLPEDANYKEGTKVEVVEAPSAEGYIFYGWTSEDADITSGEFNIYNDVVIKGKWTKLYNVTYEYEGAVPADAPAVPGRETYKAGEKVAVKAVPSVDGYTFSGWATDDATVEGGKFTMPSKDVVLKGSFEKVKVSVEDIIVDKTDITLTEGDKDEIKVTVTPDNATNKEVTYESSDESVVKVDENGNIEAVGEGTATITVTSKDDEDIKVTVTVKVAAVKYKVTYEYVGDVPEKAPAVPNDESYKVGTEVDVKNAPSVEGYDFIGWYTDFVEISDGKFTMPEKDVTLYGYFLKTPDPVVPVEKVIIDSNSTTVLEFDGSNTAEGYIKVFVNPSNATDKSVTYTSSDETVVTVDENGKITAQGIGEATITVTSKSDPSKSDSITVTVKKPYIPVSGVIVEGLDKDDKIKVDINETVKINAYVVPGDATNQKLIYTSKNPDIVTIDQNGNITAIKEGVAVIKVAADDDSEEYKEFLVVVTVPATDITVSETELELEIGDSRTVTATVTPDNASDKSVIYASSDESVVTVDENGKITAVGEGTATVTVVSASDPDVKETVTVKVNPPKNPGYTIVVPESVNINEGETKNLGVIITPDDGTIKPVYTSGDESIITVDADGNITGIKAGVTTITVDFGNGDIRVIPVVVVAVPVIPRTHHICFGKTDGIGWYEVSVNGGDFFPQGSNSTLEVEEGSILVVRVQDMWIDDEFDFYVNGSKVPMDPANTITVVVDGYMLIGALSMDVEVPDVEESLTIFEKISNFFAKIINWFKDLFTW